MNQSIYRSMQSDSLHCAKQFLWWMVCFIFFIYLFTIFFIFVLYVAVSTLDSIGFASDFIDVDSIMGSNSGEKITIFRFPHFFFSFSLKLNMVLVLLRYLNYNIYICIITQTRRQTNLWQSFEILNSMITNSLKRTSI